MTASLRVHVCDSTVYVKNIVKPEKKNEWTCKFVGFVETTYDSCKIWLKKE